MEGHVQAVEDNLVESLSFKLRPGASYVTNRRSVTFWPQGGNSYSPTGVKVIKLALNSDQWLDPATVKLFMTITNTTTVVAPNPLPSGTTAAEYTDMVPITPGPWGFFRRLRIICGGQIVEDIDYYNRVHEMFHEMKPAEKRLNDFIEGFGVHESAFYGLDQTTINYASHLSKGESQTVAFTPFAGIFRQEKFLPLRYAPIQIELEVVGNGEDAVQGPQSNLGKSKDFTISDVQFKCDLVDLDNSLDNEYTAYLMSGKSLPIHYTAITHASQVLTNGPLNHNVNVSRAFTRLKAVFVSLFSEQNNPADGEVNTFWHPMGATKYDFNKEIEFQLQVGSKLYPEYPIRSLSEAYYQLRKTLGLHIGNETMNLEQRFYRSIAFVLGVDLTKVSGSAFTGYSTKAGDMLTLKLKSANSSITLSSAYTHKLFYTLVSDGILQIGVSGVSVLE